PTTTSFPTRPKHLATALDRTRPKGRSVSHAVDGRHSCCRRSDQPYDDLHTQLQPVHPQRVGRRKESRLRRLWHSRRRASWLLRRDPGLREQKNLWPQPYSGLQWNAHVKDRLERFYRDQVCSGKILLTTAQREIADNRVAAYKKRIGPEPESEQ